MPKENESDEPARIEVKDAIRQAKSQVADILEGEAFNQLGVEEVRYDDRSNRWLITLGYNRPWNVEKRQQAAGPGPIAAGYGTPATTSKQIRTYKKVEIDGKTGAFISMKGTDD